MDSKCKIKLVSNIFIIVYVNYDSSTQNWVRLGLPPSHYIYLLWKIFQNIEWINIDGYADDGLYLSGASSNQPAVGLDCQKNSTSLRLTSLHILIWDCSPHQIYSWWISLLSDVNLVPCSSLSWSYPFLSNHHLTQPRTPETPDSAEVSSYYSNYSYFHLKYKIILLNFIWLFGLQNVLFHWNLTTQNTIGSIF